jgi:hypothetical protein
MTQVNEYKGYTLFNDIEDATLRNRNRAVIMANMVEFHTKQGKVTPRGASLLLSYFNAIPKHERNEVHQQFSINIKERGYGTA